MPAPAVTLKSHEKHGIGARPAQSQFTLSFQRGNQVPSRDAGAPHVPYRQGFLKRPGRSWLMTAFLMPLRDGRFLNARVLTAYPVMLMAGFAAAILFLGMTAHGLNDYAGRPLGTD